jgi:hypothetical protein
MVAGISRGIELKIFNLQLSRKFRVNSATLSPNKIGRFPAAVAAQRHTAGPASAACARSAALVQLRRYDVLGKLNRRDQQLHERLTRCRCALTALLSKFKVTVEYTR